MTFIILYFLVIKVCSKPVKRKSKFLTFTFWDFSIGQHSRTLWHLIGSETLYHNGLFFFISCNNSWLPVSVRERKFIPVMWCTIIHCSPFKLYRANTNRFFFTSCWVVFACEGSQISQSICNCFRNFTQMTSSCL